MNFGSLFRGLANFQLPYTIETEPYHSTALWQLYESYSKKPENTGKKLTVFKPKQGADRDLILNCISNVKRIRIPGLCNVVDIIDNSEGDIESMLIVTDYVKPLAATTKPDGINLDAVCFGVYDLLQVLKLLEPQFVIGKLCLDSIFINETGEWVIFGLECCFARAEVEKDNYQFDDYLKLSRCSIIENHKIIDRICVGKLISEVFNKVASKGVNLSKDWDSIVKDSLSTGKISIDNFGQRLVATSTWRSHKLIGLYEEMKELHIKTPQDKLRLIKQFNVVFIQSYNTIEQINGFSPGFISKLILDQLIECINFMLNDMTMYRDDVVLFLSIFLTFIAEDKGIVELSEPANEIVYRVFRLADRQVRFILLSYLPKCMTKTIKNKFNFSDKIFQFYLQGLVDSDKNLRLMTLRTIPYIVTEISDRQLNNEILRNLAKTQVDPETDIRTETILIIIKISGKLSNLSNRDNVLATIFTKSLKDPNVETKLASLYGLKKCIEIFSAEVIANKIMSVIAPGLLDKDQIIRIKAKELFNLYLTKLEKEAKSKFDDTEKVNVNEYKFDKFENTQKQSLDEIDGMIKDFMNGLMISSGNSTPTPLTPPTVPTVPITTTQTFINSKYTTTTALKVDDTETDGWAMDDAETNNHEDPWDTEFIDNKVNDFDDEWDDEW